MANCLVLEGIHLYVFFILQLIITIIGISGLCCSISSDKKSEKIKRELRQTRERLIMSNRENLRLKLKCGELKVGEKVDV